jgi:hypothetical protein
MKNHLNAPLRAPGRALFVAGGLGLLAFTGFVAPSASADGLSINIRVDAPPPPPRNEVIIERDRPGPDFVWTAGYWDGTPSHYVWVGGHWNRPPHPHSTWFAPHWDKDGDGHYHQVKGEWRDGPRH